MTRPRSPSRPPSPSPLPFRAGLAAIGLSAALLALPAGAQAQSFEFDAEAAAAIDAAIAAQTYGSVSSVMILEQGEVRHAGWYGEADADTLHDTRSVTKTITGMVAGAAIADGYLMLDTPVAGFFPDLVDAAAMDPRKQAITVEDLLTMSSVMECNDWNEYSRGNEERMYLVEDWNAFFWSLPVRGFPSWQTPPERSPYGRAFSYCTAGVQLLGEVVERAVGRSVTDYARERLLTPAGIDQLDWPENGQGRPHLGGGLRLSTASLARLGELQRQGGVLDGERILPQDWTAASVAHHAEITDSPGWEYGYLWWLAPYEVDGEQFWAAAMNGNGGNRVMVLPEFGLTLVFTNTDYNTPTMHRNAGAFFETEIVGRLSR